MKGPDSVSSPAAIHEGMGMGEGRKKQPQMPFEMKLDQFTCGIMRCGHESQRSEGHCQSHVSKIK